MTIQTVGIIGAQGTGADIARACLAAGFAVTLVDADKSALQKFREDVDTRLRAAEHACAMTADDKAAILKRLACSTQVADFHGDDFVIATGCDTSEATAVMLRATEAALGTYAIIACDAATPADGLLRPGKLIGLRLGAPADIGLIRYPQTSDETFRLAEKCLVALRNTPPAWQS